MRRIIASQSGRKGDGDRIDEAVKRIQRAMKNGGRSTLLHVEKEAQVIVAEWPEQWSAEQQTAALAYIASLAEPHKTIIRKRQDGLKTCEIARSMGLSLRVVAKSLSKSYSELLHI